MENKVMACELRDGGQSINQIREKELVKAYKVIDAASSDRYKARSVDTIVDCRLYMERSSNASTVYCALWVHGRPNRYGTGTGTAGGWGYDKQSAAVASAIKSAGITLENSISGVGDDAVRQALLAIADYLGAVDARIIEAYA